MSAAIAKPSFARGTQVTIVALAAVVLTITVDRLHLLSPWNFVWLIVLPAVIGASCNRSMKRRLGMAALLPAIACGALMITGQLFGSYT